MYSLVLMMALGNGATVPSFDNDAIRPQTSPMAIHEHRQERGRRCHGCSGGGGCWGGGGGCWGGGYGGGGCWGGGYGCSGGGYGCSGGGYGCCGSGGRYGGYYGGSGGYGGYYGSPYVYSPSYWGGTSYGTGYYSSPAYYGSTQFNNAPYGDTGYYGTGANAPMPRESGFDQNVPPVGNQNLQNPIAPGSNPTGQPNFGNPSRSPNPPPPGIGTGAPRQEGMRPAPATIVVSLPPDAKLFFDGTPTQSTSDMRTFVSPPIEPNKDFRYTLKAEMPQNGRVLTTTREVTVRAGQETNVALNFPTGDTAR